MGDEESLSQVTRDMRDGNVSRAVVPATVSTVNHPSLSPAAAATTFADDGGNSRADDDNCRL